MSIVKELFIEEYDKIIAEAEEEGKPIDDDKAGELAMERSIDRAYGKPPASQGKITLLF